MDKSKFSFIPYKVQVQSAFLLVIVSLFGNSCYLAKRLDPDKKETSVNIKKNPMQINMQDIYKKMPQAILYNLGDSVKYIVGKSTYSYQDQDSLLVVHIPVTNDSLNYIYGAKYASNTGRTLVYAVRFFPDSNATLQNFSGEMEWINFQNWKAFGLKYHSNKLVAYRAPAALAKPGWEDCLIAAHALTIDQKGQIVPAIPDSLEASQLQCDCKGNSSIFPDNRSLFLGMQRLFSSFFIKNTDSSGEWIQGDWLGGRWYPCTSYGSLPVEYQITSIGDKGNRFNFRNFMHKSRQDKVRHQ